MNPDSSNTIFQKAVAFVNNTNKHLFLTGKAGTGKTTFLKFIKDNTFKKLAVVAPTGVAAINAGGTTIHSFFQLPFGPFLPDDNYNPGSYSSEINTRSSLLRNLKLRGAKRQVIQELDLLIIDEISMVRADLLDAIDTVMRFIRKQPLLPFGGVQMVYIGDLYQLPPVAKNEEWNILKEYYNSPFFFSAHTLRAVPPLFIELKKIYRQKDDAFINLLNNIRNNCCTKADFDLLEMHYNPEFKPDKKDNYITLTSHNYQADIINKTELEKLAGKLYRYEAKVSGEFYERSYPVDKELQLKEGAQVMFIKNDKGENRRFYNGKIGTIKKIGSEKIVVLLGDNDEIELEKEIWKNINYYYSKEKDKLEEEELGTFSQYPIRLAWAITIHKSQGLTFEKAVIDAGASFAPGQVYVSLSRLTGLEGLILRSHINSDCISTDHRVIEFVRQEVNENSLQQTLEIEQQSFIRQVLLQSFLWVKVVDAVSMHFEEYEHRAIPDKEKCIAWAEELQKASSEQSEVAEKFIRQLEYLFTISHVDGYKQLLERTVAATTYFLKELEEKLLKPTQKHINEVKIKQKVKKYVKELGELTLLFNRKKQQLNQALQLAQALHKEVQIADLLNLVAQNKKAAPGSATGEQEAVTKNAKPEKGESGKITLELFKQGKSITEIATERGLAPGTVEGHLAGFVSTGEVHILDITSDETVKTILALLQEEPEASHSALREKSGNAVSYSIIKAIISYRERLVSLVVD